MKWRWIIFFVFLAAVAIIAYLRKPQCAASEAEWKATVRLEKNTRISRIHLKRPNLPTPASAWHLPELPTLEGKYVINKIEKDANVSADQLSVMPNIYAVQGTALLFYNTQDAGLPGTQLNAGAKLYVCDSGKPCETKPYKIEAVIGEKEPYTVVLRVPKTELDRIQKFAKVQLRLAALPQNTSPERKD